MWGPMFVTVKRTTEKRWGCLFTCMTTRAVHLELLYRADSDSFYQAFRRFVSTRGKPDDMYSDNGTNFVGGDKRINEGIKRWNHRRLADQLAEQKVNWHYNPALAPHSGGAWERLIRSAKIALCAVLNGQGNLNDEILQTALKEVENLLNGQPLTHMSVDPNDIQPLTLNHLLRLTGLPVGPPDVADKHAFSSRKRYKRAQRVADDFWRRWIQEYLPKRLNAASGFNPEEMWPLETWSSSWTTTHPGTSGPPAESYMSTRVKTGWCERPQ